MKLFVTTYVVLSWIYLPVVIGTDVTLLEQKQQHEKTLLWEHSQRVHAGKHRNDNNNNSQKQAWEQHSSKDESRKLQQQQQQQRQLQQQQQQTKLGMCEGYCSSDSDCNAKLTCYTEPITTSTGQLPGCPETSPVQNFCYMDINQLYPSGNGKGNGGPNHNNYDSQQIGDMITAFVENEEGGGGGSGGGSSNQPSPMPFSNTLSGSIYSPPPQNEYPLQKCVGPCNTNNDCAWFLLCYIRIDGELYVPGCQGVGDTDGTNYCYDPFDLRYYTPEPSQVPTISPTISPTLSPTASPTATPITPAPVTPAPITPAPVTPAPVVAPAIFTSQSVPSPTESPVIYVQYTQQSDPVTSPPVYPSNNVLIPLSEPGNDGIPAEVFPLSRCQGDCDGDSDCVAGLTCFLRDGYTAVPGCAGSGYENTDYCIDKMDDPAKPPIPGAFRLKMFWQSGYYWQCSTREASWCMQCFNKTCYGNTITLTPDCLRYTCEEGDILILRPCTAQNAWFEFVQVINGAVTSISELGAQYDNMKTIQYDKFVESYNRQVAKAYYEFTRAQYEYYGGIPANRTNFVMPTNLQSGPEEAFNRILANQYYQYTSTINTNVTQIVHIRIVNTNLCMQLMNDGTTIQLEQCDYTNSRQNFKPGVGNFYTGPTFELQPQVSAGCLKTSHEPRDYEMVFKNTCANAREYNTSLYNKYY